jgi:hypothetical protein
MSPYRQEAILLPFHQVQRGNTSLLSASTAVYSEEIDVPVMDLLWPGRSFRGVTTGTPIWVVSTLKPVPLSPVVDMDDRLERVA